MTVLRTIHCSIMRIWARSLRYSPIERRFVALRLE
jgi:hypothetical protein